MYEKVDHKDDVKRSLSPKLTNRYGEASSLLARSRY